jgi:hypothetical protein
MPSQFASTLASLGFELPEWCLPPSEPLVRGYEAQFALTLPADYREFLVHHGGVIGSASCAFQEPTPCGLNQGGGMFWLLCSGRDCGHVYLHDHEQRSSWPDETFHQRFPNLSDSIRDYLALRKRGALPNKPRGYEHLYRLGTTFGEFIERLEKVA